jgi:hypothetical protein
MSGNTDAPGPAPATLDPALELRLRRDEERIGADEARLARDEARLDADERTLRRSRSVAIIAAALAGTLAVAVAGLVVALFALNRDIDAVARAAPKDDSVGTVAIKNDAVTADKLAIGSVTGAALAPGAVSSPAIATGGIDRRALGRGAVGRSEVGRNALTGAQIAEGTLGRVPSARSAARATVAGDAQALGGVSPTGYISQVKFVRAATRTNARRTKGPLSAACPAGMRIIAGGAAVDGPSRGVALVRSAPTAAQDWVAVADAYRANGTPWRLVVTAVCATGGR